jgi:flagellar biosynthesis protein
MDAVGDGLGCGRFSMTQLTRKAVALAYGKHPVPVVTAKGEDDLARQMIEEAKKQGVFISEDPQLLALLSRLNVDEEIPRELYTAVAVILSWVYWLKDMRPGDEKSLNS